MSSLVWVLYFHRLIAADCGVNVVYMVISTFVQSPWRVGWKTHGISKKATQRSSRYKGILAEFAKNNLQSALESLVSWKHMFFVLFLFVVFAWLRLMPMGHFSKSPMMVGRIKYCWENLLIFKSNSWVQENRFLHFWKERKEILCYSTTIWYNLCYPTAIWYITRLFSICIGTHFFMGIFGTWNRLTPVGKLLVEL